MRLRHMRLLAAVALLLVCGLTSYAYIRYNWPNSARVADPFHGNSPPIFYRGEQLDGAVQGKGEGLKLPLPVVQSVVDPALLYEPSSQSVIITTKDKVIRLKTDQLTATVNDKPFQLQVPVTKTGDTVYVPIVPLQELYGLNVLQSDKTGAVLIRKQGEALQWGKPASSVQRAGKPIAIREGPGVKSPVVSELPSDESVMIWSEKDGWYRVQQTDGYVGFVPKAKIELDHTEVLPLPVPKPDFIPWKPLGGKVNLTWQQVTTKNPDTSKIDPMPGLNVISPQWFQLLDGDGTLKNLGDLSFSKWAHSQNYQLWALFSNGFDPKRTTDALATYDKRLVMIKQLLTFSKWYDIQGINIDFENVYLKDKANMVQFIREAVPLLHEQGLVVSIDVTVKDGSETYSQFIDRRAIGSVVDYMMVMAYDEHWATSPTAGSVASLPWVEKGVVQIMKEDDVPASKMILGIPYYTRIWTEQTVDGKTQVTSKTASMDAVQKIIKDKKLTPQFSADTGQNYIDYAEDGTLKKIWIEDATSLKSRIDLVKKLDLAGVASWSRGFETPDTWTLIKDSLEKRP